ncbi:hypothetical protein ACR6EC_12145 [Bacillus subtilis]|uniref:deoxynucleotide monophosphate kinase family protein n=1 Tax=Bacillus subtilis TaxID=1423 RepID=UPI00132718AB|nr:hypothetical protein [Bacillus subtilis]MEC2266527.1 hypothetical protein [Bacillus subtilis]MUG00731.1 hypothetical protein [Bacillus tequilensis]
MDLKVGSIFQSGDRAVLIFGISEYTDPFENKKQSGIGINLETGQVDSVNQYAYRIRSFDDLSETQLETFSHYYPILRAMSKTPIVTISGKARSGKDTLADEIVNSRSYKKLPLATPIKQVHSIIYGQLDIKDRSGLILIGETMCEKDPHIWIKVWLREALKHFTKSDKKKFVISDVRKPSEFTFFKSMGAFSVRIVADEEGRRKVIARKDGKEALNHLDDKTESYVDSFDTDMVLYNGYDQKYFEDFGMVLKRLTNEG